jgi:16S rRNA (adenine1518-N6/adenine1519-N6)-dimethyltransferase
MDAWGLRPNKAMGQNFLHAPRIVDRIVASTAAGPQETLLEIGPGLGALTLALADRCARLIAVEKDPRMVPLLRAELIAAGHEQVEIVEASILDLDLAALAGPGAPMVVLGNLPYNISSQVLVHLVAHRAVIDRAVLMFQKELAERITARPGGRDYGRLTVVLAYCAQVRPLFTVGAQNFFPRPKVDSTVVEVRFTAPPTPVRDEALFARVVQAAFGQRRKTLKNALSGSALPLDPAAAEALLAMAGIDPRRRAETLTVAEFAMLSDGLGDWLAAKG